MTFDLIAKSDLLHGQTAFSERYSLCQVTCMLIWKTWKRPVLKYSSDSWIKFSLTTDPGPSAIVWECLGTLWNLQVIVWAHFSNRFRALFRGQTANFWKDLPETRHSPSDLKMMEMLNTLPLNVICKKCSIPWPTWLSCPLFGSVWLSCYIHRRCFDHFSWKLQVKNVFGTEFCCARNQEAESTRFLEVLPKEWWREVWKVGVSHGFISFLHRS